MACSISTLQTDACSNGFVSVAQNEHQYRAVMLQLLCVWSELPESEVFAGGVEVFAGGVPVFVN